MNRLKLLVLPTLAVLLLSGCGGSEVSATAPLGGQARPYVGNFTAGNKSLTFSMTLPAYAFEPGSVIVSGVISEPSTDTRTSVAGPLSATDKGGDLEVSSRSGIYLEGSLQPSGNDLNFVGVTYHEPGLTVSNLSFVLKFR